VTEYVPALGLFGFNCTITSPVLLNATKASGSC